MTSELDDVPFKRGLSNVGGNGPPTGKYGATSVNFNGVPTGEANDDPDDFQDVYNPYLHGAATDFVI